MAKKAPKTKFMTNADGDPVPMRNVTAYEKETERKVRAIYNRWTKARAMLEKCMTECVADMDFLKGERKKGAKKGTEKKLGVKGNFSVSSFDGLITVQIQQSYQIFLDERSIQARDLMLDYANKVVAKVTEAAGENVPFLTQLIEDTFRPNSNGALPYGKVLRLLRYNITAAQWLKARALLVDSIKPQKSKQYLMVGVKPDRQHDAKNIRLDAADCWPMEEDTNVK